MLTDYGEGRALYIVYAQTLGYCLCKGGLARAEIAEQRDERSGEKQRRYAFAYAGRVLLAYVFKGKLHQSKVPFALSSSRKSSSLSCSMASRTCSMSLREKRRLWVVMSCAASISLHFTRWRIYALVKPFLQA